MSVTVDMMIFSEICGCADGCDSVSWWEIDGKYDHAGSKKISKVPSRSSKFHQHQNSSNPLPIVANAANIRWVEEKLRTKARASDRSEKVTFQNFSELIVSGRTATKPWPQIWGAMAVAAVECDFKKQATSIAMKAFHELSIAIRELDVDTLQQSIERSVEAHIPPQHEHIAIAKRKLGALLALGDAMRTPEKEVLQAAIESSVAAGIQMMTNVSKL
jgi:hypothetical protein